VEQKKGQILLLEIRSWTFWCTQHSTALKIVVNVWHSARFIARNCTCCRVYTCLSPGTVHAAECTRVYRQQLYMLQSVHVFIARNCTCCRVYTCLSPGTVHAAECTRVYVFVGISEQTAIISPHTINWFVFITEMMRIEFVYWKWEHGLDCSGSG
jgi:hypothetical protein